MDTTIGNLRAKIHREANDSADRRREPSRWSRTCAHPEGKQFTHYSIVRCLPTELVQLEREYIWKFMPRLNQQAYNGQRFTAWVKNRGYRCVGTRVGT